MNSLSERASASRTTPVNGTDGREARPKFWVAAYTRPRSEKKASTDLQKQGHETYLPLQKQIHLWSDRRKKVEVAVIPMIIFLRGTEDEISRASRNPLILKVLTRPGEHRPAAIPDCQIERLRFLLNEAEEAVSFEPGLFSVNDNVRVTRGRLRGLEGMVRESPDGTLDLIVSIDLLGGARLRISKNDIERIV